MTAQPRNHAFVLGPASQKATLLATIFCAFITLATISPCAQTFNVIHNFTGGADGGAPDAALTIDAHGNLYGTASQGAGSCSCGSVFKATRRASGWTVVPLYIFQGGSDGHGPEARVIVGPNGTLYGTTDQGGVGDCSPGQACGTVFNLQPPANARGSALSSWTETVLYRFGGGVDGANPGRATLVFDSAGNLYGTTQTGGSGSAGTVYKLTHTGGGWTKTDIVSFTGGRDGGNPESGVIFDNAGNLYGTTLSGGANGLGTVYQLTPSGSGWTKNVLHNFGAGSDGQSPEGGLLVDSAGDLFGTTVAGGEGLSGVVYKLTRSSGGFTYAVVHNFLRADAASPVDSLIMDNQGRLYGTALNGGEDNLGAVFRLTPSGGSWTFSSLRSFSGIDGNAPFGGLVLDSSGNLFGTTSAGGNDLVGVVFEIAQ